MYKVLIINPPRFKGKNVRRDERSADILESEVSPFYQGAVLAQYLRNNNNMEVGVLDANGLNIDFSQVEEWIKGYCNVETAIIKAADDTLLHDINVARICKNYNITTMLWEPVLAPAEPEIILKTVNQNKKIIDYIILGEAELTVSDYLKYKDKAKGIAYFRNNKFNINKRNENKRLESLESFPIPDFQDLPVGNYKAWFGERPWMTLFTSRGCVGSCNYCLIGGTTVFRGYGKKVRLMSANRIINEVEILIKNFNVKHITFWDDCFTIDRQRLVDFCRLIKEKNLKFRWSCMSRVDTIDDKLIKLMKETGLTRIGFGITSF